MEEKKIKIMYNTTITQKVENISKRNKSVSSAEFLTQILKH